ncbi:MAG: 16S rRNA (uracil(1498)-N(3))-methyltransferase, partial [Deltaproteobacteria bacterium]|nr:16S rRNA (uracil(1498)-N(3))-methyltransferase [Deltaproteobacteria bacterium]
EGGLTCREEDLARAGGFAPVRMGPNILRAETAALAACALALFSAPGGRQAAGSP